MVEFMTPLQVRNRDLFWLKLAAAAVWLALAWLYGMRHQTPWTQWLWNPANATVVERITGMTWSEWTRQSHHGIAQVAIGCGVGFALFAAVILMLRGAWARSRWLAVVLALPVMGVAVHLWLDVESRGGFAAQYMSEALKLASPGLLWLALVWPGLMRDQALWIARVATAATFVGHGWHAAGFSPTPAEWHFMTMKLLGLTQQGSVGFLHVMGWLDFVAAALLMLPLKSRWWLMVGAGYCAAWGAFTAIGRPWAHFTAAENWYGLDPWLAEGIIRLPHFLIPLWLLLAAVEARRTTTAKAEDC